MITYNSTNVLTIKITYRFVNVKHSMKSVEAREAKLEILL